MLISWGRTGSSESYWGARLGAEFLAELRVKRGDRGLGSCRNEGLKMLKDGERDSVKEQQCTALSGSHTHGSDVLGVFLSIGSDSRKVKSP